MGKRANIIVASSDGDQLVELINGANEISEALKAEYDVSPRVATSIDDISAKRTQDTLLLIIAASLPQSRSSCDQDDPPAIDFVRTVATGPDALACILVSERLEHYRVAQSIRCCELLVVDNTTNYVDYCLQLARKLDVIRDPPKSGPAVSRTSVAGASTVLQQTATTKYAVVEIDLPTDLNMSKVRLEIHDGNEPREPFSEPLLLKKSEVAQLVKDSKGLKKKFTSWQASPERYYDQWQVEYQRLGERLGRLLWSTQSFTAFYNHGMGAADNNIRIRFNLEQPWFDGLWEALRVRSGQRVLMLDNIVARRALPKDPGEYARRDHDKIAARDGELRILVIQSDAGIIPPENRSDPQWLSHWQRHGGTLAPLKHLKKEVEALRSIAGLAEASTSRRTTKIVVDVLPTEQREGEPWSLAAMAQAALENSAQGYDIVHFAGHALFMEDGKKREKGYLVFSGHPRPQAVSISVVAGWLAKAGVQLAYLSCCRSNAALAALELARNNIPMAIGFHWDVEDEKAPAFASEFYRELLNLDLKVCPAISKARRNLFDGSQGSDPIWASPVLIAQPWNWVQVEAVLKPPTSRAAPERAA